MHYRIQTGPAPDPKFALLRRLKVIANYLFFGDVEMAQTALDQTIHEIDSDELPIRASETAKE